MCSQFKDILSSNKTWRAQYLARWGRVSGRIAHRYCGDDSPKTFFTPSFPHWQELFREQRLIEAAWESPAQHAHRFRVDHAHARAVRALALVPSCRRVVTGSLDKIVRIWDSAHGTCVGTLQGVSGVVALDAFGDMVKAGYKSGAVRHIDVARGTILREIRLGEAIRGYTFLERKYVTCAIFFWFLLTYLQYCDLGRNGRGILG